MMWGDIRCPGAGVWRATLSAFLSTFCGRGDSDFQSPVGRQYTPDGLVKQCSRAKRGMVSALMSVYCSHNINATEFTRGCQFKFALGL